MILAKSNPVFIETTPVEYTQTETRQQMRSCIELGETCKQYSIIYCLHKISRPPVTWHQYDTEGTLYYG